MTRNDDPPDYPEPPSCDGCGEYLDLTPDGLTLLCPECGMSKPAPPPEVDGPEPEWMTEFPDVPPAEGTGPCRHGEAGECGRCDHEADLAYDAARERNFFRR
jgi:hypothetical protein